MIEYDLAVAAGAAAEAWLVAAVLLRGRRPWLQATFAALGLTLVLNGAASIGVDAGILPSAWQSAVFGTLLLTYPLTAILVLGLIHGESLPRRKPVIFLLLAGVPAFLLVTPPSLWTAAYAYDLNLLGAFLGTCLAIALAETIFQQMTSALHAGDAQWLMFGVLVLIIGGPVYTIEFIALGLPITAGSNLVAPVALVLFARVALRTAPYRAPVRRGPHRKPGVTELEAGRTVVFDERRPTYAIDSLRREASAGRPALLVARGSAPADAADTSVAVARIGPDRPAASRVLATASEFLARFPGGIVALADLGDVSWMAGWKPTREMIVSLRGVARGTRGTLLLASRCLVREELEDLQAMKLVWWTLPDPAAEIESVLARSFGPGANPLLLAFTRGHGLRAQELTLDDVPALADFLGSAVGGQDAAVADPAALGALREQASRAASDLRAFASRRPDDLASGDWPSRSHTAAEPDLVVRGDAYWEGRDLAPVAPPVAPADRRPLSERALAVFVDCLGPAGEGVFRSEVAKLGRRPQELRAQDVARLADRAAVDLSAMADVVDVPQEKARIQDQIESIRRRLDAIAGVE